jgi:hypothetical protein
VWKGFTVKEPRLYPIDPRTRLGFGDLTRIGGLFLALGLTSIVFRYFYSWYEGTGWTSYDPGEDQENSWWYWPDDYDLPIGDSFWDQMNAITITGIVAAVIGIILLIIGKALKKKDEEYKQKAMAA